MIRLTLLRSATQMMHVFAQPVLAANGGMTLEQLATLRTVTQATVSPDGGRIAYVLSVPRRVGVDDDGPAWGELHVVSRDGANRGYVTGQVNVGGLEWSPDGRSLYYLAKRQGDEARSLYRI